MKVQFLVHVLAWKPGDVAEVSDADGETLCKKTIVDKGGVLVEVRKAMPVEEVEKMKTMKVDMSKVTQAELAEMGKKNIVPTPIDAAFEKKLAKLAAVSKDADMKAEAKMKAVKEVEDGVEEKPKKKA